MADRSGVVCWPEQTVKVPSDNANVDDKRIAFDVAHDGYQYTVELVPSPEGVPWWRGTWRCRSHPNPPQGHVRAKLYKASDGGEGVVLVGGWNEEGRDWYWTAEFP